MAKNKNKMKNNSGLMIGGIIIGIIVVLIIWTVISYNGLIDARENVDTKAADVDVLLERRADLIPNLVSTVKGYVKHEEGVIEDITDAREELLDADDMEEKSEANDELTSAIDALMVIVENYPDLKANTNFINLQDELAGTENRISVARRDYNSAVKTYNTKIKKIPTNIIAAMFDFDDVDYFTVSDDKSEVPTIEF